MRHVLVECPTTIVLVDKKQSSIESNLAIIKSQCLRNYFEFALAFFSGHVSVLAILVNVCRWRFPSTVITLIR